MQEINKFENEIVFQNTTPAINISWNYDDKFEATNEFFELIGYTTNDIIALPYKHHSLISTLDAEKIKNAICELDESASTFIDYSLTVENSTYFFREYIRKVNDVNDIHFLSTLIDISDFKKREHELLDLVQEKDQLNKSKDNLISIISHDLRAPFSSLLGFSEILLNEPNLPAEERKEYLQYIYEASDLQLKMVNHLLDWTRLQTGNIRFEPRRIDIKDIIDNCISVLTGSTIRKNVEIKNESVKGYFINADERLISQVITNLLSNAVKFTPSGKKITVSTSLYKENMVEVIVADEGVGIDEKNHDKLFKIDAKFTEQGTNGEKGTGFGLTVVKEIVKKHNGDIWFYSELNKGSEFHFTLPKAENTILIIEEHEDLRNVYKNLVESDFSSHKIIFANNGFEALNLLTNNLPSLILLYHKMPMMSGLQLIQSLRKKDTHNYVKVVLLTEHLTDIEEDEYKKLGVHEFLPIEAGPDDIGTSFRKLLDLV